MVGNTIKLTYIFYLRIDENETTVRQAPILHLPERERVSPEIWRSVRS